jgi:hypothetical protein
MSENAIKINSGHGSVCHTMSTKIYTSFFLFKRRKGDGSNEVKDDICNLLVTNYREMLQCHNHHLRIPF